MSLDTGTVSFRRSKAEHADAAATRGGRAPRRGVVTATGIFRSRGRSHRHRMARRGRPAGMAVAPAGARARVNRAGCWQWWPAPDRRRVEPPGGPQTDTRNRVPCPWKAETAWMDANHATTTPHGQKQTEPGEYCTYGVLVGSTAPLVVCHAARHVPPWESRIHTHRAQELWIATALPPAVPRHGSTSRVTHT